MAKKSATRKKTTKKKRAKKKTRKAANPKSSSGISTKPKFPYATTPNSLRRFLELVPNKPKPRKINFDALKAWGLKNTNDQSIIRVLKKLELVDSGNNPTDRYTEFMSHDKGPRVLGSAIKEVWSPLFEHSHAPHRDDDATLRNYFHIHSGGSDATIQLQIQTFKAVCDHADLSAEVPSSQTASLSKSDTGFQSSTGSGVGPAIHIDLHIHLPEKKSRRDYEYIFEDIARYIFGRDVGSDSSERP